MILCSRSIVSARMRSWSGIEQRLDPPNQRIERKAIGSGASRDLLGTFTLSLREQLAHHPWPRARIARPIVVESRRQAFVQNRLQLPRAQIARGIKTRVHIDERIGSLVLETRRVAEQRHVKIGKLRPGDFTAIQRALVEKLCTVPAQVMELLESGRAQKLSDSLTLQSGVALQPAFVLHAMVEQHRIRFGDRVVTQPSKLECIIGTGVAEVQCVSELVKESVVIALTAVRAQHQVYFLWHAHRRTERPRTF